MRTSSGLAFFGFALGIPAWSFLAMSRGVGGLGSWAWLPSTSNNKNSFLFFWACVVSDSRKKYLLGGGNLGIRRRAYGIVVNWILFLFRKHIPILIFFFSPTSSSPQKNREKNTDRFSNSNKMFSFFFLMVNRWKTYTCRKRACACTLAKGLPQVKLTSQHGMHYHKAKQEGKRLSHPKKQAEKKKRKGKGERDLLLLLLFGNDRLLVGSLPPSYTGGKR